MEMMTAGSVRRADTSQILTTNKPTSGFLQAGCPSCRQANNVKALLKVKASHFMDCSPQAHQGFSQPIWFDLEPPNS